MVRIAGLDGDAPLVQIVFNRLHANIGHADGAYSVRVGARTATAPALVIATGGPSIPQMGATGFAVFTRRGGGSAGAAGFCGSAAFLPGAGFLPLTAGVSAKMLPPGSWMLRCFASRSALNYSTAPRGASARFSCADWKRCRS